MYLRTVILQPKAKMPLGGFKVLSLENNIVWASEDKSSLFQLKIGKKHVS